MVGGTSTITYPVALVLCAVLAGASVLGWHGTLSGDFVGTIYGTVLGGGLVGHFSTVGSSNG